jgi:hypothetical protein
MLVRIERLAAHYEVNASMYQLSQRVLDYA